MITGLAQTDVSQLIAIAGPPASGESFLAQWLATELKKAGGFAKVIPMDGFHLDNRLLLQCKRLER